MSASSRQPIGIWGERSGPGASGAICSAVSMWRPWNCPPLRERNGDVELLLERLSADLAEQYRLAGPCYTRAAVEAMKNYFWPGNVRELRNLCERMTILFTGGMVDVTQLPAELRRPTQDVCKPQAFELPKGGLKLEDVETDLIRQALERANGNRSRAARLLGVTRDTLLYRLKKYELTDYATR